MTRRFASLGEIVSINPRGDSLAADDEVSFVGMADLDAATAAAYPRETRRFSDVSKGYTIFRDRDVLAAKITPCWENGKVGQARLAHTVGAGSTEFHVLRPAGDVHDRYLLHFLRQPSVRRDGERRMTGSAGQRRVPVSFLADLKLPLPPINEQRRIADILDRADALRAKRRQALALLDDLAQSIFLDMFGDPLANTKRLKQRAIGDIGVVVTGNTPPRADDTNYGDDIEWIKSDNLGRGIFPTPAAEGLSTHGRTRARIVSPGAVMITCIAGTPASIGRASIADREVAFNQQINSVVLEGMNPIFFWAQLRVRRALVQQMSTGGMKGLVSKSQLQKVSVLDASSDDQLAFAAKILNGQAQRRIAEQARDGIEDLFATLQHRAFAGLL